MRLTTRRILVATLWFVVSTSDSAMAQAPGAGAKIGVNASSAPGLDEAIGAPEAESARRAGLIAGGFVGFPVNARVAVQPEVLFSMRGGNLRADGEEGLTFRLNYVEVPVLAHIRFGAGPRVWPFVVAGPSVGFNVSARAREGPADEDVSDDMKDVELALAFGGGVQVGRLLIEGRLTQGLTDVAEDEAGLLQAVRNRVWSILAGVRF